MHLLLALWTAFFVSILSLGLDHLSRRLVGNILWIHRLNLLFNLICIVCLALCLLIGGTWSVETTEEYFRIFLVFLIVLYLFITPWMLFYHFTHSFTITGLLTIVSTLMFTRGSDIFSLESLIIKIGVVGVAIMAGLSGFAAVSAPLNYLAAFKINVDQKVLESVKRQLSSSIDMVLNKKKYILKNSVKSNSFWGNFGFFNSSTSVMEQEVTHLNNFVDEMYLDLYDLILESENHRFSQTIKGKFMNIFGYLFSVICIFKVSNSLFQLVFKRFHPGEGSVTKALTILVVKLGVKLDVNYWSQILSLILIALLMASSIRGFLLQSLKVFRYIRPLMDKTVMILLFSQLIGVYSVSMLFMLRPNLPKESSSRILLRKFVNMDDFAYHQQWYDSIFVISCLVSMIIMGIEYRLRFQKYKGQKQWID